VIFKAGDAVIITCDGRTVAGVVSLASPNGVSLILMFEALLHGHAGYMPVLKHDDGVFRSLIGAHPVQIDPRPTGRWMQ
jgi:antitoxin (DNA-binding transcriptional repressor) of toxin-antitoxin stability system